MIKARSYVSPDSLLNISPFAIADFICDAEQKNITFLWEIFWFLCWLMQNHIVRWIFICLNLLS